MTTTSAICIGCGCSDDLACSGGCYWVRINRKQAKGVCSKCSHLVKHWDAVLRRAVKPSAEVKRLLRWAIPYLRGLNESLADCHRDPRTRLITPRSVRLEVGKVRRWIEDAERVLKS